jgi:hypothetical protein
LFLNRGILFYPRQSKWPLSSNRSSPLKKGEADQTVPSSARS